MALVFQLLIFTFFNLNQKNEWGKMMKKWTYREYIRTSRFNEYFFRTKNFLMLKNHAKWKLLIFFYTEINYILATMFNSWICTRGINHIVPPTHEIDFRLPVFTKRKFPINPHPPYTYNILLIKNWKKHRRKFLILTKKLFHCWHSNSCFCVCNITVTP